MKGVLYFDCCCRIGPRHAKDALMPWSVEDTLRWMDRCGIDGALVTHTLSGQYDPLWARERLAGETAKARGRLFPVWSVLPPDAGDSEPDPAALLEAMDRAGVRAVELQPRSLAFPFAPAVIGPVLGALERRRILTLIDYAELPGEPTAAYVALSAILGAFPGLPVLLQNVSWGWQRVVTALMARHANLHIEFSTFQANRAIEVYAGRFGPERLLFGTGLPEKSAGAARAYVDYAGLPAESKALIAGGNLARLLGGLSPSGRAPAPADPLVEAAAEGRPLPDVEVLDAHCHILHEGGSGAGAYVMYRGDADGLVGLKDVLGIRQTAIMTWAGPVGGDPASNDIVARACRKYPDRFIGLCYVNPTHVAREAMMAEVRQRVEEEGCLGLKPYVKVGLEYNDPVYAPCWEYANARGLYALLHIGAGQVPGVVGDLAARFPRVQWVVAHTGGSYGMARAVVDTMRRHGNVWAELTLTPVTNGVIEWMVSQVGDERILFGTDAPMRDPRPQFGWVVWSDLPVESRRRILGGNFSRLLEIVRRGKG